jgi:hypothetical protein
MGSFRQDNSLGGFLAKNAKSAAYHEAGHIVAAVLQEMPMQDGGIHIDMEGSGVSYYCHRSPGNDANSDGDTIEREKTIIAIYAGWVAQRKHFPDCDDGDSWESDRLTVNGLLEELSSATPRVRQVVLWERALKLVQANWTTIEGLALALLAKPVTSMPQLEFKKGWSKGNKKQEKFMARREVEAYLSDRQMRLI